MSRRVEAIACPARGCDSVVKYIQDHVNKKHRDMTKEEFEELCCPDPYNMLRCEDCHYAASRMNGIYRHECLHTYGNSGLDRVVTGAELAAPSPDIHVDADELRIEEGSEVDIDGSDHGMPRVGAMKQPTLSHLHAEALRNFKTVVVKLLQMSLGEDDTGEMVDGRALEAVRNLPGCIASIEYRAGGNSENRKKHVGSVLKGLVRSISTNTLLVDIEGLESAMANRLSRLRGRRRMNNMGMAWEKVKGRADTLVRIGNVAAALTLVLEWEEDNDALPNLHTAEEVRQLVATMYRQGTELDRVMPYMDRCEGERVEGLEITPPIQLTEDQVRSGMLSLARGRASGQSGWTNELLKLLALDEDPNAPLIPLFTRWFNRTLRGAGGPPAMWTLGRAALIGKQDGGVRALIIGDTIMRCLMRVTAFAVKDEAAQKLAPHQFSVGVKGGAEQITQAFSLRERLIRESGGADAMAATDIRQAYPSILRSFIADSVWEYMPQLYPIFEWCYGGSSSLVLASGEEVDTIETGLRQGDPLATLFFNLAIKPILSRVAEAVPRVLLMFYSDDGNVQGKAEDVKTACSLLVEEFRAVGLEFHCAKSIYYDGQPFEEGSMENIGTMACGEMIRFKRAAGAKILGRAIGDAAFVGSSVRNTLSKHMRGMDKIGRLPADVALVLLLYCVNARPMFMARNFPPEIVQESLLQFDAAVDRSVATICQVVDHSDAWWVPALRGLPVNLAGLSLARLARVCEAAHVACLIEALVGLSSRYSREVVDSLREGVSTSQLNLITHYLPFLVENQVLRLPGEERPDLLHVGQQVDRHRLYVEEMSRAKQSALCREMHKDDHKELHSKLLHAKEFTRAAMVLSTQPQRQLARWIRGGLQGNMHNRLDAPDYCEALRLRLMVTEYKEGRGICGCCLRRPVDTEFIHLLHCQYAQREITFRHDLVVSALEVYCQKCLGSDGIVRKEVVFERRGELSACRIDLVVTNGFGEEYLIDVAVVNQGAKSYMQLTDDTLALPNRGSCTVQGWAAEQKSEEKRNHAMQLLTPVQLAAFVPFSIETTGRLGLDAKDFLFKMEQCYMARIRDPAVALATFSKIRRTLFLEMGMILVRGSSRILAKSRLGIRRPQPRPAGEEQDGPIVEFYDYEEEALAAEAANLNMLQDIGDRLLIYSQEDRQGGDGPLGP